MAAFGKASSVSGTPSPSLSTAARLVTAAEPPVYPVRVVVTVTVALFVQSYTIGRVLLDVEPHTKKDETDWINLIDQIAELALLP